MSYVSDQRLPYASNYDYVGFRVACIPEPGSALLLLLGAVVITRRAAR